MYVVAKLMLAFNEKCDDKYDFDAIYFDRGFFIANVFNTKFLINTLYF